MVQHDGGGDRAINNFQLEDQTNLTLEETSKGLRLKDDVVFALLITISLHMIIMFNEISNLLGLDIILNGKPIGLGNCANRQCGSIIGESSSRRDNRSW